MPIIDIHTHGIGGYETRGATHQDILKIAEIHGSHGVDAIIPTIYSGPIDEMRADITAVKKAMELQAVGDGCSRFKVQGSTLTDYKSKIQNKKSNVRTEKNLEPRTLNLEPRTLNPEPRTLNPEPQALWDASPATILGVHLEGPFLNPARAGVLDGNSFLPAKTAHFKKLIEGFGEIVKIITVAPELDGAPMLIRSIADTGIIVSMGHSDATYSEADTGFNAGAKGITHIFNAMRGIHHREPGIAGFGLTNPHVYVEIIADPFHLHPKIIEMIFIAKKPETIIIVSDSVKATQIDTATHGVADSTGRLLGGSMTIIESIEYLMGLGLQKSAVQRCIRANPEMYLTSGSSLAVLS
jgi:N-acetylglucosamine-6-phosphate deacetylase